MPSHQKDSTVTRFRPLVLATCCLLLSSDAGVIRAQTLVTGVVRAQDGDMPLAGARVAAIVNGKPAGNAVSTRDGQFELAVPDGEFDLAVSKAGYAPLRLTVAALAAGRPLDVRLVRGAVITGRVLDQTGLPSADTPVRVRRAGSDVAAPGPWLMATTNDLGEYRVGSLPAGTYEVALHPAFVLTQASGLVSASGMNVTRLMSALSGLPVPDRMAGPPAVAELQPGRESVVDIVRPPSPAGTQSSAATTQGLRAGMEMARQMFGAKPVDPDTAGRLSGVVVGPDSRPTQALVRMLSGDGSIVPLMAVTDEAGRYEFDAVPPGTYRVIARGSGTMEAEYGATFTNQTGSWVEVRPRERVEKIDISLPRAAVVSGRVLDEYGEPLEGLNVDIWETRRFGGRLVVQPAISASSATTDDRGYFRLHGLVPGRYYIVASEAADSGPSDAGPAQAIQASLSSAISMMSMPPRAHAYYPGRATVQDASPVVIDIGVDAHGLDMVFVRAPRATVSGVALGPDGRPMTATVTLVLSRRSGAPLLPAYRTTTGPDGAFSFEHVVPGEYVLQAAGQGPGGPLGALLSSAAAAGGGIGGAGVTITGAGGASDVMSTLLTAPAWTADTVPGFATTFVTVSGASLPSVTLQATVGSSLAGRFIFEGSGTPPTPEAFALGFVPADSDLARAGVPLARGAADGTFEAFGLVGPMRAVAVAAPAGWWLKSVTIDGVNAAEHGAAFGTPAQSRRNVEVVFSSARSGVGGRVLNASREPAAAASVLVFPTDWSRWYEGTAFVRQAPVSDGAFELSALPPGSYYVAAVDPVTVVMAAEWQDPERVTRLIPLAQQVTVREGRIEKVELTIADVPR